MISVAGCFFIAAFLFSPAHGIIWRRWKQRRMIREAAADN
jgi:manganese/zinc/iron transport system permease protein